MVCSMNWYRYLVHRFVHTYSHLCKLLNTKYDKKEDEQAYNLLCSYHSMFSKDKTIRLTKKTVSKMKLVIVNTRRMQTA